MWAPLEVAVRLVTFYASEQARAGALLNDAVIDLNRADASIPADVLSIIQGGPVVFDRVRQATERAASAARFPLSDVRLLAPIPRPPKIICIGVNYADHAAEAGRALPNWPSLFMKAPSAVIGPHDEIQRPPNTERLDYEVELAVAIGKTAKSVSRDDAMSCVAGYTIMNDVSARDLQLGKDGGIILGKNFDTSAPLGPCIVLADELPDPTNLSIRTWINGDLRQDSNTRYLIFDIPAIIEFISRQLTLEPGDLIATGTPAGVGLGMDPQVWLQPGDQIRMEIEGIGVLENRVAED